MSTGRSDTGFTLVELMVVVLIIGILVAIAVPAYAGSRAAAQERTCLSNQRIIESTSQAFSADHDQELASLAGVVTGGHPLIDAYILRQPPSCPSAPGVADQNTVDPDHGAYTLDEHGNVAPCPFGDPAHGNLH